MNSVQLRRSVNFPGSTHTVLRRLRDAGLRSRRAAQKQKLTDEQMVYRLAFAEEKYTSRWGDVIFSDECNFHQQMMVRYASFGHPGTRHNAEYVAEAWRSGRVSVACWGWMSARGIGMLHRIDQGPNGRGRPVGSMCRFWRISWSLPCGCFIPTESFISSRTSLLCTSPNRFKNGSRDRTKSSFSIGLLAVPT